MADQRRAAPPPMGFRPGGPPLAFLQDAPKSKDTSATLRRLWRYLQQQRWTLIGVVALVIVTAVVDLIGPYLMGLAIDTYIATGDLAGLTVLLAWMGVSYVAAAAGTWWQTYLMAGVAQRAVRDIRADLFARLQTLPLRTFDQRPHGDLMSRLTNDVENVSNVLATSASQLIANLIGLVGVVVLMFVISVPLAIVSLIVMPLTVLITRQIAARTRVGFRETQAALGELNGIIEETVTGERVVQAFVREAATTAQFSVVNRRLQKVALRARVLTSFMGPLMNMVNNFGLAVVACAGGWLAVGGMATVGEIASFINYAGRLGRPLNMIAQLFTSIQAALAGAERVFELMDEASEADVDAPAPFAHIHGHVRLDHVSFGYDANVPVLKDVSLTAKPGEMIALVGPTGAGKTTIANLLTRFYDIASGTIAIDGIDVATVRKDDLRRRIGLVLQDNFLFADTVMANIRYGRLDASDADVIAAAKTANADAFIHRLPHGYQTVLTERGGNLSQGQRQLLAIARAAVADPPVLILDEATSSIDTRTEQIVQKGMDALMKGRTTFVIAHRLSTVRNSDVIIVLDHGHIIERGTHDELIAKHGTYYQLYTGAFERE